MVQRRKEGLQYHVQYGTNNKVSTTKLVCNSVEKACTQYIHVGSSCTSRQRTRAEWTRLGCLEGEKEEEKEELRGEEGERLQPLALSRREVLHERFEEIVQLVLRLTLCRTFNESNGSRFSRYGHFILLDFLS